MERVYETARIFRKKNLTGYQQRINDEAGNIAMNHPELLARRGELLEKARANVKELGYAYKKGKSRSCKEDQHNVPPKRSKINAEIREKRIKELQDEISILDEQIKFKVIVDFYLFRWSECTKQLEFSGKKI